MTKLILLTILTVVNIQAGILDVAIPDDKFKREIWISDHYNELVARVKKLTFSDIENLKQYKREGSRDDYKMIKIGNSFKLVLAHLGAPDSIRFEKGGSGPPDFPTLEWVYRSNASRIHFSILFQLNASLLDVNVIKTRVEKK